MFFCMDLTFLHICAIFLCFAFILKEHFGDCDIQSLITLPTNSQVVEGESVILNCHVSNQVGSVQWSKDGLLLGFDPEIPGFPRYSISGNTSMGIYNLKIENAKLEDDADFECQVGPAEGQDSIVAKAHLTVLLQPTSIEISGNSNGSTIQVKVSESLSLECVVKGGKPAPDIIWYRNSFKLSDDQSKKSISSENGGIETAKSTLGINPNPDDNQAEYLCEASTSFSSGKIKAFVKLDVLYPPNKPIIEGYRRNERIRAGESVNLICIARGGNPLARLVWTKNEQLLDHSYTTSEWESINEISFTAGPSDDGATYTCSASNIMTPQPLKKQVVLQVLYAPKSLAITGPKEAKPGDLITVTCNTERSNPASEITWVIDGRPMQSDNIVESDEHGGWITSSTITTNVTEQDRNSKMFTCYAVNQDLGETITKSFTVSILYAPDPPAIFGYMEGTAIHAGKLQRLTCISHGGNPLPELKWFKGEEELKGSQSSTTGTIISKELTIIAAANDNGAVYQCRSSSKALAEPLVSSITLTVYFPPSIPTIKVKPKKPKAGSQIKLTCECSNSNPAASISWWNSGTKDEIIGSPTNAVTAASDHQGFITKSVLYLNVTAEDDGSKLICQATNEAMQQSAHDAIVLYITYKPVFQIADQSEYNVKENDSTIIDVTAKGNPSNISYTWKRGTEIVWEGSVFNISAAERSLTGTYTCFAKNEIGESSVTIILKVLYPMVIIKEAGEISEKVIISEPYSNVKLECNADGYPLPNDAISWKHDGFNMQERTEVISSSQGKSILLIKNVTKDVSGAFSCEANNGVGSTDNWKIFVLVKHEPLIKDLDSYKTILSDRKKSTELQCKAEGVPDVAFSWSFEGVIVSNKNSRIKHETTKLDHFVWKSILTIEDVNIKDFGEYKCVARNEIGFDTAEITLIPDSAPDPPAVIKVTNITRKSIFLVWVPGFDGGHNQTYRVRYKSVKDPAFMYIDVHPPSANSIWIKNLKSETEYEVAMMSFNVKGQSSYSTDKIKVRTLGLSDDTLKSSDDLSFTGSLVELLVASIGTVFLLLFLFNIVLLALYYKKKKPRSKTRRKYSEDYTSSLSDISVSSKIQSEETTFSSYTTESRVSEDRLSSYTSHSLTSEQKSTTYSSTSESETEGYSEDRFSDTISQAFPSSSKFI